MNLSVVGTGYVGLVAGACFADSGNRVVCVDIDEAKIKRLSAGEIPIYEPGLAEIVKRNQKAGRLTFTTDIAAAVKHAGAIFIAVGTPELADGSADLSAILEVARTIGLGFVERLLRYSKVALPPDHPEGPVDWVSGAAVMFRFEPLATQSFFDPVYFLYFEEVDLMRRLTRAGGRVLYVPKARVIHLAGVCTSVKTGHIARRRRPDYVYRSWRHYFQRQHGRAYAVVTALLVFLAACIHVAASRLRGKPTGLPAAFLGDHWRHVLRPLLGGSQ